MIDADDMQSFANARLSVEHAKGRVKRVTAYWKAAKLRKAVHAVVFKVVPGRVCDHINRSPLDNRKANLRAASWSQSAANRNLPTGYSGYRGVYIGRTLGTWEAFITHNGKRRMLGRFKDKDSAAAAYDREAVRLFGPEAVTNGVVGAERIELPTAPV